MKKILFFFLVLNSFAFEVFLNTGKENNTQIDILHIKDEQDINCLTLQDNNTNIYYKCSVLGRAKLIANQDLKLFKIVFQNKKEKLDIFIYPKTQSLILPLDENDFLKKEIKNKTSDKSKYWSIIFYPDYKVKNAVNGLDFDVLYPNLNLPFVGGLDLDKNPVNISDNADISTYLDLKKFYESKKYKELLDLSLQAINKYGKSIFLSEFYLYKIRAMVELLHQDSTYADEIIKDVKDYAKKFASSENYPETLQLLIKTYLKIEQSSNAQYFIDILNNEHPNSYYTKLANLDYADYLLAHNKKQQASLLYNNTLFTSNSTTLASKAAIALARINISDKKIAEAKEFVLKVFNANKPFLLEDKEKTIALADDFYNNKLYDIAAVIYEFVLDNSNSQNQYYEKSLKNLALSLSKIKEYDKAQKYLNEYKKLYSNGEYLSVIDEAIDLLYFHSKETDSFKLHEYYKLLMAKYDNEISDRALLEEVKLLFKEKEYTQILNYDKKIKKLENNVLSDLFDKSLKILIDSSLKTKDCDIALDLIKDYDFNEFAKLNNKKSLVVCLIRKYEDDLAFKAASEFINEDDIFYSIKQAQILFKKQEYKESIKILNKTLKSRKSIYKDEYFDIYSTLSLSYLRLNDYNNAIFNLKKLEKISNDFKIVEIYNEFLAYFNKNKMPLSIITYGQKAIDIQNKIGVNLYSPELEFITLDALISKNEFKKAEEIVKDLLKLKLDDSDYTRALFLQAKIYKALNKIDLAKQSLSKCKEGNNYKQLCDDELSLLN